MSNREGSSENKWKKEISSCERFHISMVPWNTRVWCHGNTTSLPWKVPWMEVKTKIHSIRQLFESPETDGRIWITVATLITYRKCEKLYRNFERIITSNTELQLWLGADPKLSICSTLSIVTESWGVNQTNLEKAGIKPIRRLWEWPNIKYLRSWLVSFIDIAAK